MPAAGTKQQLCESTRPTDDSRDLPTMPGVVLGEFEQMCVAMSVSGALIAVRDLAGMRCTVSFGNAPAVGSWLPMDSAFTKQCVGTGEFVLCEDTESDARIDRSVARRLSFRSAVAVPIQVQGSVVGMIEVFCSRSAAISPMAIAALKKVAKSFAAVMIFDAVNGGEPVIGGALERPIVLSGQVNQGSTPVANPPAEPIEEPEKRIRRIVRTTTRTAEPGRTKAAASRRAPKSDVTAQLPSDKPVPTRVWLIAAALLLGFSILLLFLFRGGSSESTYRTNASENVVRASAFIKHSPRLVR